MAKKKKTHKKQYDDLTKLDTLIPKKYSHWAALLIIIVSFVIFFNQLLFNDKDFLAADYIAAISYQPFIEKAEEQGLFPLWTPYLFSGLPSYASMIASGDRWYDFTQKAFSLTNDLIRALFWDRYIFVVILFHILFGVGVYALAYQQTGNSGASLFAAISISFCLGIIIWAMEGHYTKARSLISLPLLLLVIDRMKHRLKLWHVLVTVLLVHMHGPHIQMVYYSIMAIVIYFAFFFVRNLLKKESVAGLVKAGVVLGLCAGFAFFMEADRYLSTLEYNQYSIRGVGPLVETDEASGTPGGGLDYEYATNWSFSPQELTTFLVPSFYGYGTWEYRGPLTDHRPVRVNTYFGQMPFTVAPVYMGVVFLALAIIGMIMYRKEPFVQYLMLLSGIALLISFGRTFPVLYDPMFHYAPMFDKFRVPSMILILVQISLAVCAAYGIKGVIELAGNKKRQIPLWLRRTLVAAGTLFILSFLARGVFENSYTGLIAASGRQVPPQLYSWIYERMMNDLSFNLGLLCATFGLIFLYIRRSVPAALLIAGLLLLTTVDLWRVAYRPMDVHPARDFEHLFQAGSAVQYIRNDEDIFRIVQLQNNQPLADNRISYHLIQDIYGYHPAKLRVYQDMIDIAGITNPFVWNLLNVKYILADQFYETDFLRPVHDGDRKVMENIHRLPRAWFVDRVETGSPVPILEAIRDGTFHPREVAFLEQQPDFTVDPPGEASHAEVSDFGLHHITLDVRSEGDQFLVLSEVYYPAGWHAYLNGRETDILKTNYFMRGMVIPPGEHTLEMVFRPSTFYTGKRLSMITNGIVVIFAVGLLAVTYRRRRKISRRE
jgi:hypothetical protein